jgi:hypothetical protein
LTIGYTPAGQRIVRSVSRKNKGDERDDLKKLIRTCEDGLATAATSATTVTTATILANQHIITALGARGL